MEGDGSVFRVSNVDKGLFWGKYWYITGRRGGGWIVV